MFREAPTYSYQNNRVPSSHWPLRKVRMERNHSHTYIWPNGHNSGEARTCFARVSASSFMLNISDLAATRSALRASKREAVRASVCACLRWKRLLKQENRDSIVFATYPHDENKTYNTKCVNEKRANRSWQANKSKQTHQHSDSK
jgi:hypothetical protein